MNDVRTNFLLHVFQIFRIESQFENLEKIFKFGNWKREIRSVSRFPDPSLIHLPISPTFKHRRRNDASIYCDFTTGAARLPVLWCIKVATHKQNVRGDWHDERKIGRATGKVCNKSRPALLQEKNIGRLTPLAGCAPMRPIPDELLHCANLRGLPAQGKGGRNVVRRLYGRTRRSSESASTSLQPELSED